MSVVPQTGSRAACQLRIEPPSSGRQKVEVVVGSPQPCMYLMMSLEVQCDANLPIGGRVVLGNVELVVASIRGGWYLLHTPGEVKISNIDIWDKMTTGRLSFPRQ